METLKELRRKKRLAFVRKKENLLSIQFWAARVALVFGIAGSAIGLGNWHLKTKSREYEAKSQKEFLEIQEKYKREDEAHASKMRALEEKYHTSVFKNMTDMQLQDAMEMRRNEEMIERIRAVNPSNVIEPASREGKLPRFHWDNPHMEGIPYKVDWVDVPTNTVAPPTNRNGGKKRAYIRMSFKGKPVSPAIFSKRNNKPKFARLRRR